MVVGEQQAGGPWENIPKCTGLSIWGRKNKNQPGEAGEHCGQEETQTVLEGGAGRGWALGSRAGAPGGEQPQAGRGDTRGKAGGSEDWAGGPES